MPINQQHKISFIHIPRTGGVALCDALNFEATGNHSTYEYYQKNYPDYFSFSIVRNPYERFISAFFFMKRFDEMYPYKARYSHLYKFGIEGLVDKLDKTGSLLVRPQVSFICDENMNVGINKVFKDVNKAFEFLMKKFNFTQNVLQRKNMTIHKSYDFYLKGDLKKKVYNFYKNDFITFGYTE